MEGFANIFDLLAEKYDAWYDSDEGRPLYESELLCLKPIVENAPGPILEVGVGTGRFAMHFPDVIGIDPSPNALKMAKQRGIKTVRAYGEDLPFADHTFGCVLIIVTLCFVKEPLEVLKEAKRVLRKNGSIIIGLVPKDSPWGNFYEKKRGEGHPFYGGATFYSFGNLKELLEETGMRITRVRSTLLQRPEEARRIEESMEGYAKD
ncbi:MAG: class I SAM-dependent methyltransferase, partial [Nitrospirota bacterium]